jgi:alkylhydroperoxidase family enzyme
LFTEKERAALYWTEVVTGLTYKGISDADYGYVSTHLNEQELVELTFALGLINTWNRLSVAFRPKPGDMDKMLGLDKAGLA